LLIAFEFHPGVQSSMLTDAKDSPRHALFRKWLPAKKAELCIVKIILFSFGLNKL
jgi:hypothetical protein